MYYLWLEMQAYCHFRQPAEARVGSTRRRASSYRHKHSRAWQLGVYPGLCAGLFLDFTDADLGVQLSKLGSSPCAIRTASAIHHVAAIRLARAGELM
jgi:hypothetical protein